jgi:hypothetical protein
MRAVVVRPWSDDDDDAQAYTHSASVLFSVPDTVWWRGASPPDPVRRTVALAHIQDAVNVARTTCLPDLILIRASGSTTRVSRRPSHATTQFVYLEHPRDTERDWVVVYGPAPACFDVDGTLAHTAVGGCLADSRPLVSGLLHIDASRPVRMRPTPPGSPSPALARALAHLLFLDAPLSVGLQHVTPYVTRFSGVPVEGSRVNLTAWIDGASVPVPCVDLARLFAPGDGEDGDGDAGCDGLVVWLSSRLVLYASLVLGHIQSPLLPRDPASDLAVDLRLRARGAQTHVPPRQAALESFLASVRCVLDETAPLRAASNPAIDAFARRVVERVCAHSCIK